MNTLVIKKEDLIYNIKQIKQLVEKLGKDDKGNFVKIIALIEENGYGLGLIEYVKILIENGISIFAIETIEEAIKLKKEKIKQDIVYIKPTAIKEDIQNLVENDIIITLGSKQDIENANEIGKKLKKKIRAYLEIDTKVGTSGFMYNNREELIIALKSSENIKIEGTFSKLKDSLNDDKYTKIQFQRFIDVIEILKMNQIETGILNICDETAFFRFSTMNLNAIRIEKAFLGENISARNIINLRKPITLETKISEIKKLPKGAYIGNLKIKKEITICIIPYLCKDEIKQKSIIINNQQCKILGNIDNNIICDITKKDIKIGQKIILPIENSSNVNIEVRREYR